MHAMRPTMQLKCICNVCWQIVRKTRGWLGYRKISPWVVSYHVAVMRTRQRSTSGRSSKDLGLLMASSLSLILRVSSMSAVPPTTFFLCLTAMSARRPHIPPDTFHLRHVRTFYNDPSYIYIILSDFKTDLKLTNYILFKMFLWFYSTRLIDN